MLESYVLNSVTALMRPEKHGHKHSQGEWAVEGGAPQVEEDQDPAKVPTPRVAHNYQKLGRGRKHPSLSLQELNAATSLQPLALTANICHIKPVDLGYLEVQSLGS